MTAANHEDAARAAAMAYAKEVRHRRWRDNYVAFLSGYRAGRAWGMEEAAVIVDGYTDSLFGSFTDTPEVIIEAIRAATKENQ